ncbi:MAG: hypothetical protein [Caudoviricetes sp.]|nr:MAG: hypothetical protein [Caudoviricetes sp.]
MNNMSIIRLCDRSMYALALIEINNIDANPINTYTKLIEKSYSLVPIIVQNLINSLPENDPRLVECNDAFNENVRRIEMILRRRNASETQIRAILESIL